MERFMLYLDLFSNKPDPPNPLGKGGHESDPPNPLGKGGHELRISKIDRINRINRQLNS
jgi:hypothetical protein